MKNRHYAAALITAVITAVLGSAFILWYGGAFAPGLEADISRTITVPAEIGPFGNESFPPPRFVRNSAAVDFTGLEFTEWDVSEASSKLTKRGRKPYTVMVYMNGSDLESENGAATEDLIEMLESGLDPNAANLVVFTGGTNRWRNDVVPENRCVVWEIRDGGIYRLADVGLVNMGDPGTLASFIDFTVGSFPADKYGLIMWDHGGGSIAGYGSDEKFLKGNLTLLDLNYAFSRSALSKEKLEFLGFDSCLMGTAEMAVVAKDYARYMIASEDLEPGCGWDYGFLSALNDFSGCDGGTLGRVIVDTFMEFYGDKYCEDLNLSVIDLSEADSVMYCMGRLMEACSEGLAEERTAAFRSLAKQRNRTRTFGVGSPRDNESDMVDLGDMASKLYGLYPEEAVALLSALEKCVVYNRNNSGMYLSGLSTYYIYYSRETAVESLDTYSTLHMEKDYTDYLRRFYGLLTRNGNSFSRGGRAGDAAGPDEEDIVSRDITVWTPVENREDWYMMAGIAAGGGASEATVSDVNLPRINGRNVCMYRISDGPNRTYYAVPAAVNGNDCDLIVSFGESNPDGTVFGARYEDGFIIQKGYDPIESGDKVAFWYPVKYFGENGGGEGEYWHRGAEFTAGNGLELTWDGLSGEGYYYSTRITDIRNNEYYTDLKQISHGLVGRYASCPAKQPELARIDAHPVRTLRVPFASYAYRPAGRFFGATLPAAKIAVSPIYLTNTPETKEVPVIMYHLITPDKRQQGKYGISPEEMEADLIYLRDNGYETVVMRDLIDFVNEGVPLPEKPVALTFDDGRSSDFSYLLPLLEKYDMNAVIAIVGRFADDFTKDTSSRKPHLEWGQIQKLAESGRVEMQSHSYDLHGGNGAGIRRGESSEAYRSRLKADLAKSTGQIKEMTGFAVTTFTYPLGVVSNGSKEVLRELGIEASLSCYEGMHVFRQGEPDSLYRIRRNIRKHGQSLGSVLEGLEK